MSDLLLLCVLCVLFFVCFLVPVQLELADVQGRCPIAPHNAWTRGNQHPLVTLTMMPEVACPAGALVAGLGVEACDDDKALRFVAQCARLPGPATTSAGAFESKLTA